MVQVVVGTETCEISGRWLKTARLADEWYRDLDDPDTLVSDLKRSSARADLFSFWQRLPYTESRYPYFVEWESIAVLPIKTYDHWYRSQINNKTRNLIVKAAKKGLTVRTSAFTDEFVRGMTAIFNETPIRQERPFWHYGKSFETIKREFSRYLFREELIGAYLGDELIGFIMLADAGRYAMIGQIISMVGHRDKSPNNLLMAKAVEVCAERQIPNLVYALWPQGPLREFKRHNGFECVKLPRYYVPLTMKGALALRLGLHRDPVEKLPPRLVSVLKDLRMRFYLRRYRSQLQVESRHLAKPQHVSS
jgi:hypothetical protein